MTPVRHVNGVRSSLSDDRVMAMLEGSDGAVWVGTMGGGLNRVDPTTLKSESFAHDPAVPTSLGAAGVMSLLEVDKQLWVGTFGGGISRFDARTRRFENLRPGPEDGLHLSNGRVTALARDRSGHVWIGTDGGGLNVWDLKTRRLYYYKRDAKRLDTLSADTIYSILVDDTGGVWIGTRGGGLDRVLNPLDAPHNLRFANISEAQGLPNNTVYGLRADGAGNIWISTNFGLARLDPRTSAIQRFHRLHGLQAEEFNFGAHYRDRSGKLFFGGAAGFNAFYPEVLEFNERPPRVVLTQFLKLNTPGIVGVPEERIERLSLGHKEDVITLKFAALDFADPRANRYEYKLDGFDTFLGARRRASRRDLHQPARWQVRVPRACQQQRWRVEHAGPRAAHRRGAVALAFAGRVCELHAARRVHAADGLVCAATPHCTRGRTPHGTRAASQ